MIQLFTGVLAALLLGSLADDDVEAQIGGLFLEVEPSMALEDISTDPSGTRIRGRLVRIDFERLADARVDAGRGGAAPAALRLNLFDDVVFSAIVESTASTASGYSLSGRLDGVQLGTVTLVVNGDVVAGTVRTPLATFTIRSTSIGVHVIRQVDPLTLPQGGEPLVPPTVPTRYDRIGPITFPDRETPFPSMDADPPLSADEDGSRVDVLVLYTPAARAGEGGADAIEVLIDLMVAETNASYANSGVIQRISLVQTLEVSYTEQGSGIADVRNLQGASEGFLDEVHAMREQYEADIVHLIVDRDEGGNFDVCGIAYYMETPSHEFEAWAFGITDYRCGGGVFAHELGHNMGLKHDRYAERTELNDSRNPYGYGYVNQRAFDVDAPESSRWRTIMAYKDQCDLNGFSCPRLLRFSTPDMSVTGDLIGVPGTNPSSSLTGPSAAGRRLDDTRTTVANFRVAACLRTEPPARISLQASSGQYLTAELNGGGAVSANRNAVGEWETFQLTGNNNGGCLESGDTVYVRTSDGFYFRAEGGGGSSMDVTAPRAGSWEAFQIHRVGGRRIGNSDTVALQAGTHYLVAEEGGGSTVNANRTGVGLWGKFRIATVQ